MIEEEALKKLAENNKLREKAHSVFMAMCDHKYSYHFSWLGRPIIQFPQDILAVQEIIWKIKPDLIIETGIAHGGSLVLNASLLALLDLTDKKDDINRQDFASRKVIGIDVDIRDHNRIEIENHPLKEWITMIEGSSISAEVSKKVANLANNYKNILVMLDSNHTHEHVLKELEIYSKFVSPGSYIIVFDTVIEKMPASYFNNRPWDVGNNPMTAVKEFLKNNKDFIVDKHFDDKLIFSVVPQGYLKKIK